MPRHKFTDAQIAMVVREIENGARVQEVSRKLGVTENTLYNWKRKYAGMGRPKSGDCANWKRRTPG